MKITSTCLQPLSTTGCTLRFSGSSVGTWHLGVDHVASVQRMTWTKRRAQSTGKQWQWQIKVNHRPSPPWNMLVQPIVTIVVDQKHVMTLLLMLQTSGCHQLEVGSLCPPKLSGFLYSWVVQDLFHQQYFHLCSGGVFSKGLLVKVL